MLSNSLSVFAAPERYVQGRNATERLGTEMKNIGIKGPVVVISSATPKRLLEQSWTKSLKETGYEFSYLSFGGTCTGDEAQRIVVEAEQTGSTTIVAFGGGQVIDAARAAADLVDGLEFVSCPTVASTDAPCSALSVMYHEDHTFHEYRFIKRHPVLVLVDSTAIAQSPRRTLVGGLGDALATWFEARTIKEARATNFLGGMPTQTSTALAKLCYDILIADGATAVQAVDAKAVTPALERVIEANTLLSGLGFESGGLCVSHSVHNGLTSQPICAEYTHGEKVAFGLLTQLVLEGRPADEIRTVLNFCTTVGLPVTLKGVGVDASDDRVIKEIATRTLAPGESAHHEPFDITIEMMSDALRSADRTGMLFEKGIQA